MSPSTRTIPPAETGRGRGVTEVHPPSRNIQGTSKEKQHKPGNISPSGTGTSSGSPIDSPPESQQHSPTASSSSGPSGTVAVGRAAQRGAVQSHGIASRTDIAREGIAGLSLEEQQQRPEAQIESVTYTRPKSCIEKKGTAGNSINLMCNYFEVNNAADWVLYQYHVDFLPVIESKKMRLGLFNVHADLFPTNKAFDGSTLYTLTKLPDEVTEVASTREHDKEIITIRIKRICEIVSTSPQFVHLFNLVFRRCLKLYGMKMIDRNYYDTKQRVDIEGYNVQLINGFATSIANYENKLLLCAELTHKLLHKTTIWDKMNDLYVRARQDMTYFKQMATAELVGSIIMTKYNEKTYRIDDIDWNSTPQSEFERGGRNPGKTNFITYYREQYQCNIEDPVQPLLVSLPKERDKRRGQTGPILLVPELCIQTGMTDKMRQDFRFKKALEKFSKVGPSERCSRLSSFVKTFRQQADVKEELDKWKVSFDAKPCEIAGRVLPPETLQFGRDSKKEIGTRADWGSDMKGAALLNSIPLHNWIVVYPERASHTCESFVQAYGSCIRGMGIDARPPAKYSIPEDKPELIVNCLKQKLTADKSIQLVFVLVTSKRKDRYDAIKRICCLDLPVPSQVCTTQIVDDDRKRMSVVTKIAIQMNCKLGGEVWKSNIPLKNVMMCGIDTYHDSEKKNKSVCAFIATTNGSYTRFFSRAMSQETHQELSNNLTLTMRSACEYYKKCNGDYPVKIIVYRDGISDGQLKLVTDYEIPQMKKAFSMLDENYEPLLSVIVVKKRGNSRFFFNNRGKIDNPPCGTVIDTVVTRQEWFDFYLTSQVVNQGTVNPTHYNVVHDELGYKADHLQKLSYKLTHMYYNWPGTIRVPALCQYAHKLAFLVGQSLHKEHDLSLSDKLFYL